LTFYKDGLKFIQRLILDATACRVQLLHIINLQEEFSFNKTNKNAPFVNISDAENTAQNKPWNHLTDGQWWKMDKSDDEIIAHSAKKAKMTVLLERWKDTIMTLSIQRYYKSFYNRVWWQWNHKLEILKHGLRYHYKYFQYDHVGQGARQVGSTFKPFVHATAIEQLNMSPATRSLMRHLQCRWTSSCYRSLVTKKLWQPVPRNGKKH
jgi:penicillin-binding protein 1A